MFKAIKEFFSQFGTVVQTVPSSGTYEFTPVSTFFAPEFQSEYCKGMTYTVRTGNKKLHLAVQTWLDNKQVTLRPTTSTTKPASLFGVGMRT